MGAFKCPKVARDGIRARLFTYHIVTYFLHSHHSIVRYGSHKYDTLMLRDRLFLYLTTFRINGHSNVKKVTQDGKVARIFTHPIVTCFIHPYQGIVRRGTDR